MTPDILRSLIARATALVSTPIEKERIEIHICTQDFYSLLRSCDQGELLNTFFGYTFLGFPLFRQSESEYGTRILMRL